MLPAFVMPRRNDVSEIFRATIKAQGPMGSGFFEDIGGFVWDGITGLTESLQGALGKIFELVGHIGETIALIVRACLGDVSWNAVLGELGQVFQDIGAIMVFLDPSRQAYNWLSQSPLTAHCFAELDKFTGGMISTATNLSDLPGRVLRGDPISKQELLADIILIIEVVAIVFTGPVGIGIMLGTMVGREVCSHQTEARDACMATFQIIGAAAGSWASAASGLTWGTAGEILDDQLLSTAEETAWLEGDAAYQAFLENQASAIALNSTTAFTPHLTAAGQAWLTSTGVDVATREIVNICQRQGWVGDNECAIIGSIAADYVKAPAGTAWEDFLAGEVARIGAEQIMLQWFPENSPEHIAIKKQWQIKYVDVPVDQTVVVQKRIDPKAFLLAAGAVAFVLMGAS